MNHLVENNLITDGQHEFRENRSCLTNMLCYLDDIINNVDKSNFVHVKRLDCEKAFDKVPRRRLNMKVEAMGISGNVSKCIRSFLADRSH